MLTRALRFGLHHTYQTKTRRRSVLANTRRYLRRHRRFGSPPEKIRINQPSVNVTNLLGLKFHRHHSARRLRDTPPHLRRSIRRESKIRRRRVLRLLPLNRRLAHRIHQRLHRNSNHHQRRRDPGEIKRRRFGEIIRERVSVRIGVVSVENVLDMDESVTQQRLQVSVEPRAGPDSVSGAQSREASVSLRIQMA